MSLQNILSYKGEVFEEAIDKAREMSYTHFGKKIHFYAPSFVHYKTNHFRSSPTKFPAVSITGSSCTLRCLHCNGKVLNNMIPIKTPDELYDLCVKLKKKGALGCLISGGCLQDGSVPLGNFIDTISRIKSDLTKFTVAVHTGIIDSLTAKKLKDAKVDVAMIDVIGSSKTIREIYRLEVSIKDIKNSLEALNRSEIPFVPHVMVGIHYGNILGEINALEIIAKYNPPAVIIIALTPIFGTQMQNVAPPKAEEIAKVLIIARNMMPKTPIVLGCMRPKGENRIKTDIFAVRTGINAIVYPTKEAVEVAESMDLDITFSPTCCSQIFEDIK
jgi:uncharacterized radical SAM superfamily protein